MLPVIRKNESFPSLIDELFNWDWPRITSGRINHAPAVNISEGEKEYTIEVAAPGLKKDDLKVEMEDNVLTISFEKKEEKENKDSHYVRKEFSYNSFSRSFILPDNVNSEKIEASHKDGILYIRVPKPEEPKKITKQIKVA